MPLYALRTPGSASVPGAPKIDYSQAEDEVVNIPSIKFWPCLAPYGAKSGVVLDRVEQFAIPSYGSSNALANFVTMVNGKTGYKVTAIAQALGMNPFVNSGSFTIGCVCADQLAFGSLTSGAASDASAPWGVYSNLAGSGAIVANFGTLALSEATSGAWAKKLSATKLTAVVLIFDRNLGRISIRYDGVEMWSYTNDLVKTIGLKPELNMGALRVAGQSSDATRPMVSNAFTAFGSALAGTELASLEKMLIEAAAAA
ncbi:hypothetical protein [Pseudomonas juntendi]|uniref:hypothetical protein n=1 Tax=Pseudomonas juntendi TaxID=2666183 RepID=UPI00244757AB|nr:hypothetical protein [Pseudomonas juntendi]MDH1548594.1 hypothetical protein [Pseudomonas juntendi]